jgi:hypothetical protein
MAAVLGRLLISSSPACWEEQVRHEGEEKLKKTIGHESRVSEHGFKP